MKTAEEYWSEHWNNKEPNVLPLLKRIQLDAIRHGMTLATQAVAAIPPIPKERQRLTRVMCVDAILTARDNLKP